MSNQNKNNHIEMGFIDVPIEYQSFTEDKKKILCNRIIDSMLTQIDKEVPEYINRIIFLTEILESTLITNEQHENYEVCAVVRDILKQLND